MAGAAPSDSTNIWALLVSIEQYGDKDWPTLKGANNDTTRTAEYLHTQLHVPKDHIVELKNEEATRANILSNFQSFLINNPRIAHGDAIIFHFSGHGSRSPAPQGWPVFEDDDEDDDMPQDNVAKIEMIVPYDEGVPDPTTGKIITGIPDRTLGALLARLSEKFGNNITVVLDCCHSGHGTRGSTEDEEAAAFFAEYVSRGIDPLLMTPLREDVDADILSAAPAQTDSLNKEGQERPKKRRGFRGISGRSHVLMAACSPHESALGNKQGGLLTTYWLAALRKQNIFPRTYNEIWKDIAHSLDTLRVKHPKFITQHPQCEGLGRERLVFENYMMSEDFFPAERRKDLSSHVVRIEAGEAQGVEVGTLFELHELDKRLQPRATLGSATAKEVYDTYTIAEFPEGILFAEPKCIALILLQPYKLRFAVHNAASGSDQARNTLELIRKSIRETPDIIAHSLQELEYSQDVQIDLTIEVDEDGAATFHRHDPYLSTLTTPPPRIDPEDVPNADFPSILGTIAHFNWCLALTSKSRSFSNDVSLEFHLLDPTSALEPDGSDESVLALGNEVPFVGPDLESVPEAHILDRIGDEYAFVLRNQSTSPLFLYLVYFDPATYAIETWYAPYEADKPSLHAVNDRGSPGIVQLGGSAEVHDPFEFSVPEWVQRGKHGKSLDTSFIKVWLLTRTAKMDFVNQLGVLGFDENGDNNVLKPEKHRAGIKGAETRSGWDTIVRKITVSLD